jgi:hypothetical protein
VVVGANQAISIAPITPLPQGAYSIVLYLSETPGSLVLRRLVQISGWSTYVISELPEVDAALPPATNMTDLSIDSPTVAPPATAAAAVVGQQDFPAQPRWITIGSDTPMLMAVGTSPDAPDGMAWWAMADAPFTFRRGTYDPEVLGEPVHAIRDGNIPGVAYFAAGEGFGKTTSYFVDDAFLFREKGVGETPSMIGYGNLHSLVARGNIVWCAVVTYASSAPVGPIVVNALTDVGFVRRSVHPCSTHLGVDTIFPLLIAGSGVLITYSQKRGGGTSKTMPGGGPNNCYRSTDGGATWTACAPTYVVWVASDGAGTVYALCTPGLADGPGGSLQKSTDSGATWSTVFSGFPLEFAHTGATPSHLWVDPDNPDRVGLRQNSLFLSTDGGVTFPKIYDSSDKSGFGTGWGTAFTPAGGHLMYTQDFNIQPGRRMTVAGGSVTEVIPIAQDGDNLRQYERGAGGMYVYGSGDNTQARRSTDDGVTWEVIFDVANVPVDQDPFYATRVGSADFLAGDSQNGWYWFPSSGPIKIAQGPQGDEPPTGPYLSLQSQAEAVFTDGAIQCSLDGAVQLPVEE